MMMANLRRVGTLALLLSCFATVVGGSVSVRGRNLVETSNEAVAEEALKRELVAEDDGVPAARELLNYGGRGYYYSWYGGGYYGGFYKGYTAFYGGYGGFYNSFYRGYGGFYPGFYTGYYSFYGAGYFYPSFYSGYGGVYSGFYNNFYSGFYNFYNNFYTGFYDNFYGGFYNNFYSGFYNNFYSGFYNNFYSFYNSFYNNFYSFYGGFYNNFYSFYGGFYNNFYSFYNSFYNNFYSFYGGFYDGFYAGYNLYPSYFGGYYGGFYNSFYNFYNSFYGGYNWYYTGFSNYFYGGFYNFYSWYTNYFYGGYSFYNFYNFYGNYFANYNFYSGLYGGYGHHRFGGVNYNYYGDYSQTFTPGYNGYYYYYWYHYADSTDHWAEKMRLGWTNWADVLQGAYIVQASTFIQTWKCHETTALTNVLAFSQYRKDVCENGDRRWIFARGDPKQYIVVDLGETRWVSEIGVDFGDANERLPKSITMSYLSSTSDQVNPSLFTFFGNVGSQISEYTKLVKSSGVSARYIMWEFESKADPTAFMQLVAAGPDYQESASAGYIALIVIIVLCLLAVGGFMYCFLKNKQKPRRYYKAKTISGADLAKENAEFSSDSESSSDDDSDDSDSSGSTDSSAEGV